MGIEDKFWTEDYPKGVSITTTEENEVNRPFNSEVQNTIT